jgi:hypothetical protein
MSRKRYMERIIGKLREAEVAFASEAEGLAELLITAMSQNLS